MPWIKKNPHLFILLLVSVLVIAGSVLVARESSNFDHKFDEARQNRPPKPTTQALDLSTVAAQKAQVDSPAKWSSEVFGRQPMFVPARYSLKKDGSGLEKAGVGQTYTDYLTGQPMDDKWFMDNRLPLTNANVGLMDPDQDGFYNADEWRAKTDPNDPAKHPAYTTKLYLKEYIRKRFLLKFNAYDGTPDKPDEMSYQINSREFPRAPTQFLKIGDTLFGNKFKIKKFEYKTRLNEKIGEEEDVSELTLENIFTGDSVVLVHRQEVDSPDSYAAFAFFWSKPAKSPKEYVIQGAAKKAKFPLPGLTGEYQLLDVVEGKATILTPDGKTIEILPIPDTLK